MLSALLVALREGVEAALVVGICLAYLGKVERTDLKRTVWYAVGASVVASFLLAFALERFAWNEETFEGVFLLAAAVLLVSMIVWMRRVARSLRGEIEQRVGGFAARSRFAALGLFLFVFLMIAREGAETVLLLRAVALDTEGLFIWMGTLIGLAAAVGLAYAFFQGTLPIRLDRFFDATSWMLTVLAAQLTLTGIHELSEAAVIPSGPRMMSILGPIVRNDIFFFAILLGVAAWIVGREMLHKRHTTVLTGGLNDAEQRLIRWKQKREREWMTALVVASAVVLVTLTTDYVYALNGAQLSPAVPVASVEGEIRLAVADRNLADGQLHRFQFDDGATSVRFIVIRRPDGTFATALDACEICGPLGYYQEGGNVICKNCSAVIYIPSIGQPGGCNPIPVESQLEGKELVISVAALTGGGASPVHSH